MEIIAAPLQGRRLAALRDFLLKNGINYDEGVQFTVLALEDDDIIASGSLDGNVLKCIAVSAEHQGGGLAATVVSRLVSQAVLEGIIHLFLFTKPENDRLFAGLGFYEIARTEDVLLMENKRGGIREFVMSLEAPPCEGVVGAVVANCNPFTNGHLFLIEKASAGCDLLRLFILSEDKSRFSASNRLELVRAGTKHLKNVVVHPTGSYLVSSATFPDYFLKDKAGAGDVSTALDLTVFAECFARPLGITKRFVGTEPLCSVTSAYNRQMKLILPERGVEVVEIPRMEIGGEPVSASRVRELLDRGDMAGLRPLVPETTFSFLERMRFHDR